MNAKIIIGFLLGVIIGAFGTYLIITFSNGRNYSDESDNNRNSTEEDCRYMNIDKSLQDYIEFYIDNDDFYVLPNSIKIKYQGNCTFHIKIIRQSRRFSDIQHTNYLEAKIDAEKIQWRNLN
jgi:hypothetical protein